MIGKEYYFLVSLNEIPVGTHRIYKFDGDKFTTGSWVFLESLDSIVSVKSSIATRHFAFSLPSKTKNQFDVHVENVGVIRFHQLFQPNLLRTENSFSYFELTKEAFYRRLDFIATVCGLQLQDLKI
jgi:hypothetical protein